MMERLRESRWVYILLSVLAEAVVFCLYIRYSEDPTMQSAHLAGSVQIAKAGTGGAGTAVSACLGVA